MVLAKNGTHCGRWECSHSIAGNIKGFACKPAYASCVNWALSPLINTDLRIVPPHEVGRMRERGETGGRVAQVVPDGARVPADLARLPAQVVVVPHVLLLVGDHHTRVQEVRYYDHLVCRRL